MIICEQLKKNYRKREVLSDVSFRVEEPKIIGLIGRNGVGKSTLLRLLSGHLKSTGGQVEVIGRKPFQNLTVAANTIFIEEAMCFPADLTLKEIMMSAKKFYVHFAADLALELLRFASISPENYHYQLSKGQKAVFNLIYGLSSRSAVTLLDEPMNGMDEAVREAMYRVILKEYIAYPRILIISSHYLNEMEHLIEEILLLHNGKAALFAPVEEVQQLAVRLVGQKSAVEPTLADHEVLAVYENGPIFEAVIKNSAVRLPDGVKKQTMSASDVCKALTSTKGESVDGIYRNSQSGA